jgi:hypothetical protein
MKPKIVSVCSQLPKHVAERQISSALFKLEIMVSIAEAILHHLKHHYHQVPQF